MTVTEKQRLLTVRELIQVKENAVKYQKALELIRFQLAHIEHSDRTKVERSIYKISCEALDDGL
jgi:hypothetical protein